MNVLDILLLVAAVWFAVVGYRQGFVVGILSVIGFLGGGLVAVYTLPVIWDAVTGDAPFMTRCSLSKKSAEYSGYDAIGRKPGNGANVVPVHSHPLPTRSSTPQALRPAG